MLKVSRTIVDLAGEVRIQVTHLTYDEASGEAYTLSNGIVCVGGPLPQVI